jgi:hypothetical protein
MLTPMRFVVVLGWFALATAGCNGSDADTDVLPDLCDDASGTYNLVIDWRDVASDCGREGVDASTWTITRASGNDYDVIGHNPTLSGVAHTEVNTSGDCVLRFELAFQHGGRFYDLGGSLTSVVEVMEGVEGVGTVEDGMAGCSQTCSMRGVRRF